MSSSIAATETAVVVVKFDSITRHHSIHQKRYYYASARCTLGLIPAQWSDAGRWGQWLAALIHLKTDSIDAKWTEESDLSRRGPLTIVGGVGTYPAKPPK